MIRLPTTGPFTHAIRHEQSPSPESARLPTTARHAHAVQSNAGTNPKKDAACVAVASLLPSCKDQNWLEQESFLEKLDQITGEIEVDLDELIESVDSSFAEFAPILKLSVPERTLADWLREDANT